MGDKYCAKLYVLITPEQKQWLEQQAKAEDRSVAWIVRKTIDIARSNIACE